MALVVGGVFDVNAAFVDAVRANTYACEASVTAGGTQADDGTSADGGAGDSRYTAVCHKSLSTGNRIAIGTLTHAPAWSAAVRFIGRSSGDSDGTYMSILSRGGVFPNDSQIAFGWRSTNLNGSAFNYARNVDSLLGAENAGIGLTAGNLYTLIARWQNGGQTLDLWDGTSLTSKATSASGVSTDGSQVSYIGGPVTPGGSEGSIQADILGVLIYDSYIDDTTRDAIAADFYGQIPEGGVPDADITQLPRGFARGFGRGFVSSMAQINGLWQHKSRHLWTPSGLAPQGA